MTFNEGDKFKESHQVSDVDRSPDSLHHSLGKRPNQSSPGNHKHSLKSWSVATAGPTTVTVSGVLTDITGATITVPAVGIGDDFLVFVTVDLIKNDTTNAAIRAYLYVDGVDQGSNFNVRHSGSAAGSGISGWRATYTKVWKVTGLSKGDHIFKLAMDESTATPGSWTAAGGTTTFTVLRVGNHGY